MPDSRPFVLLVTRNLPPLLGGMERLNLRLISALAIRFRVAVVGPLGCRPHLALAERVIEVSWKSLRWFLMGALCAAIRLSLRLRPAWVLAGSGLSAPIAWMAARLSGAKVMVYVHGLDLVVQNQIYQWLWMPFIRRADLVVANSRNTALLARARGVLEGRLCVVNPGASAAASDMPISSRFKEAHALTDRVVLLSVGRLTPRKGVHWFVENCLAPLKAQCPAAVLLVIGGDPSDALAPPRASQQRRILDLAQRLGLESSVLLLPPCDDETLALAYAAADVHLFPLVETKGDVEGFGMVAIEAAMYGLPTVAFSVGGVADAIVPGVTGDLVRPGDAEAFNEALIRWIGRAGDAEARASCKAAAARWDWVRFDAEIRDHLLGSRRVGGD